MNIPQTYHPAEVAVEPKGAEAPGLEWEEAARLLLNAVGYYDDISSAPGPAELAELLMNSDFVLTRQDIVNGVISGAEDSTGFLLERDDGKWLAVLGNDRDATVLAPSGARLVPFDAVDRGAITAAWALSEEAVDKGAVAPFLHKYKKHFISLFIAAIIVNFFSLTLPLFSAFVYDKILGNGIYDTLWALVIGVALLAGIELCVRIVRINIAERFAVGSEVDIDDNTFRNLLNTSSTKMPSLGTLLEKYKQVLSLRDFLSSSYLLALADLPFIALFLITIIAIAGPLALIGLVCGTLSLLTGLFFTAPVLDYDRQSKAASERRFGLMTDVMTAREAVIGGAMQNELSRRWNQSSVTAVTAASKARYWRGVAMSISNSLAYLCYVGVLVGGVYMVQNRTLTAGGLLAASLLTSRMMASFASVNTLLIRYRELRIALRELNKIVEAPPPAPKKSYGRLQGAIRIDKMTCRLRDGDHPILNEINLHIPPGELVGIAGAPGAGKTTLLRLIAGVLQPEEGQILIDNIPLKNLSPGDVSRNIGFKPQEFGLLDGTIEDNVRAGRAALSVKDRYDVLQASGLAFAFQENGLNWTTDIGPRGSNISGGQRQLVALARALHAHPPLLLLDEPTNGLDGPLEAHLAKQLVHMRGRSTILVSTHSRNILSICDRIIVIGQGRILANGPRDKVLAS